MIVDNSNWEIPSSIDLESFLKKYKPNFKYKKDHFYYIVEYLGKSMEQSDLNDNEGYINTSAVILQNKFKNYKKYLQHMLDNGLIKTDMRYIVGEKCKGYLLCGSNSNDVTLSKIPIVDYVSRKNRSKENANSMIKIHTTKKKYPYLTKWFDNRLKIDSVKASAEINKLFPVQTGPIRGKLKGKPSVFNMRIKAIYSLNRFSKQLFYFSVDDNVGRFHSNLANIKRELRNFITYDGHKLVNVDIKNSQPLLSTLLFNPKFYDKDERLSIYNFKKGSSSLFSSSNSPSPSNVFTSSSSSSSAIMLGKTLQNTANKEYREYIDMVNSGDFYKKLHDKIYSQLPYNKAKMKEILFTVFFSNNKFIGQPEAQSKRDFKKAFPEVYEVFKVIKKNKHQTLARLLQRIESDIIIRNASKRISIEKPNLPIFTIHDSIATIQGNENYISDIIKEEVFQLTGLNAKIGLEYWNP